MEGCPRFHPGPLAGYVDDNQRPGLLFGDFVRSP